jgi:ABC-type transport system involved in multi-copper enzyme maturation permease subunit
MSSTKAVTRDAQQGPPDPWQGTDTQAPSLVRRDDPSFARVIGMLGAACVIFGGMALILNRGGKVTPLGNGWASFFLAVGLGGLLVHAAFDWDVQFRRIYMAFAYLALVVGVFVSFLPYPQKAGDQFGLGFGLMAIALLFLLAFLRNETDPFLRQLGQYVLGGAGAVMALTGLFGGNLHVEFLVPFGVLLGLLGLVYLTGFVLSRGIGDDLAYRAALAMTAAGVLIFLVALGRVVAAGRPIEFLVPSGILLLILGVAYVAVGYALFSDQALPVLTRRELGAFFYSPMAYIVLAVCVVAYGVSYFMYMLQLLAPPEFGRAPVFEPIVRGFILQWPPVIFTIIVVPALTMRVLSEERRSGTLEVLLTVPVNETAVTLSKFLAAFLMYLLTWVPFALYLIYMRVDTGKPFDYRPLLSFFIGVCATGAGFVSMGVFFSSLTRNQIAAFLITAVAMLALTSLFLVRFMVEGQLGGASAWVTFLNHISYLDIWINTLDGKLQPRYLLFFASLTVLWLFLTAKVLEARRWAW